MGFGVDYSWGDRQAEGVAAGLVRDKAIVHNGWQIGPGGYAANGTTTITAAERLAPRRRIWSAMS